MARAVALVNGTPREGFQLRLASIRGLNDGPIKRVYTGAFWIEGFELLGSGRSHDYWMRVCLDPRIKGHVQWQVLI
jgi:hypothetical protein